MSKATYKRVDTIDNLKLAFKKQLTSSQSKILFFVSSFDESERTELSMEIMKILTSDLDKLLAFPMYMGSDETYPRFKIKSRQTLKDALT